MKRYLLPLAILMLTACHKEAATTAALSAAEQIYNLYAGHANLTVAIVGNYPSKGDTINAVMLQAQSDSAWYALLDEFELPTPRSDTERVSSMVVSKFHSDTAFGTLDQFPDSLLHTLIGKVPNFDSTLAVTKIQVWKNGEMVQDTLNVVSDIPRRCMSQLCQDAMGMGATGSNRLVKITLSDGKTGYIIRTNGDTQTLWLFFYGSQAQYEAILNRLDNR